MQDYATSNYAKCAIEAHDHFLRLGATPLLPVTRGDDQTDLLEVFESWKVSVVNELAKVGTMKPDAPLLKSSSLGH